MIGAQRLVRCTTALLLPALFTGWLAFRAGGFLPGTVALTVLALGVALVLMTTTADRPLRGMTPAIGVAAAALGSLAVWALLSAGWSGAPGRAILEFDRALLYALLVLLAGAVGGGRERLGWTLAGVLVAAVVVCGAGLVSRTLPAVLPTEPNVVNERLSYPVTYWNALALLASYGLVLAFHFAASVREPRWARVAAAAVLPVLAGALYFTFSRGGIGMALLGLLAWAALARPRGLPLALVAALPTAGALAVAYGADALAVPLPTGPVAEAQGREVAAAVAVAMLAGAALRAALLRFDARMPPLALPRRARRPALVVGVAALVAVPLVLGAPAAARDAWDGFVTGDQVVTSDLRERLVTAGNNGRIDHWRVAVGSWRDASQPLLGTGAGTFELAWERERATEFGVIDGHGLYTEMLGELGLAGLGLVLVAVLALGGPLLVRALRAPWGERDAIVPAAVVFGMWAVHAGVDWDWEMPVVTGTALLLAARALASARAGGVVPSRPVRVVAGIAVLALMITPWLVLRSQAALDDGVRALVAGDCPRAVDRSLDAIAALGARAEPWEVLAYCDARLGQDELAVGAARQAVRRDPDSWETHYALAVVSAAAGLDPRPALRAAAARNPLEPIVTRTRRLFAGARTPAELRRAAQRAELPIR